jgi:hypothetical protein
MNITGFNPTQGGDGTSVTITLANMPADASRANTLVVLSGSQSVNVDSVDAAAGTIEITIGPTSQTGDFGVIVNSPSQGPQYDTSAEVFTVPTPSGRPRITSAPPAALRNTTVILSGFDLTGAELVRVGSVTILNIQVTANRIQFTLPSAVPLGPARVSARYAEWGMVDAPRMMTVVSGPATENEVTA